MSKSTLAGTGYAFAGGVAGANTVDVEDEGVAVNTATTINFIGAGVTATDAGGGVANVTIPGGATESTAIIATATATATVVAGNPVYFDRTTNPGQLLKAQATSEAGADCVGVVKTGVSAGASCTFYTAGNIPVKFTAAPATSNNGDPVYVDASTAGDATLTMPTASGEVVFLLGHLTGANGVSTTPTVLLRLTRLYGIA